MTSAEQIIERVEAVGGELRCNGERIHCSLPEDAAHLLDELRAHRDEVLALLRKREEIPPMSPGVRLIRWSLANPPIAIETCAVVTNPILFAKCTLEQLRVAIENPKHWVGWSVP